MTVSDTHPVPPLFMGKVRNVVPEVLAIIGGGVPVPSPVADEPEGSGAAEVASPSEGAGRKVATPPVILSTPAPPDAGGPVAPLKRRRF